MVTTQDHMPEANIYNFQGEIKGKLKLDESIFGVAIKSEIVQQAIVAQEANSREVIAHTKDRSEVRGGGRKPWKQKGTGRARHGSNRSPLWIGGGITFGPNEYRNFSKKINKKVRKSALRMALTDKAQENKIYLIEDSFIPEKKTKSAFALLKNIKLRKLKIQEKQTEEKAKKSSHAKEENILVVLPKDKKEYARYFRNIFKVTPISVESLNVVDILKSKHLVMPVASIDAIAKILNK
ncbi:MAG: 50S ribosomal protein L4 [Parcubacteria group bacterium GW2011_GWA2_38_13]|nr:MAG: 50S ribosomal protein L4 [Parcubacteria group bacterium GW2011_GWA2_38_13]